MEIRSFIWKNGPTYYIDLEGLYISINRYVDINKNPESVKETYFKLKDKHDILTTNVKLLEKLYGEKPNAT